MPLSSIRAPPSFSIPFFPTESPQRGERENSSPVKKSIYIYYPPTRLYLQIESTFIQSSPPRWKRKRQRVGKSGSVLTIDRIKSLSSRRAPLNLHEPSISTDEKPWSNEKRRKRKRKIGHNRRRGRRNGEDREDESVGYESRGQKREGVGSIPEERTRETSKISTYAITGVGSHLNAPPLPVCSLS